MRNIYIPAAIAFLAIFIMVSFLFFRPGGKVDKKNQIKKEVKERVVEKNNNEIENKKEDKKEVFYSEKDDTPQFMMESYGEPRHDAASHRMDEKYFKYFRFDDYDYMKKNMQEKIISLHNAEVKANKGKKVYTDVD
ncbi:MAG: hypothetical protein J6Z11_17160 [Candidatus Riflebacteria bacterium]|nr:hypothetical protein [Candidatus Riflebacteria bacterium]